jgi:tetraprenyl-beta-curcumene synthase
VALELLDTKKVGIEGAVAFASFAPTHRRLVARAITTFQVALDYLDTLTERPNPNPVANGFCLNSALRVAVTPEALHTDYYLHNARRDDAGYLTSLVDTCSDAIARLPSFDHIARPAQRVLSRIVAYQSLNHGDGKGSRAAFANWARSLATGEANLVWWEAAAAAGSQLTLLALLAAAADPQLTPQRVSALEGAYFPWVAALSTLLDSVIDGPDDDAQGQPNPISHYGSPEAAAQRLGEIATEAARRVRALPDAQHHALLLHAMAAFFHVQAPSPSARLATQAVLDATGATRSPALLVFKLRRALTRSAHDRASLYTTVEAKSRAKEYR